jgi:cytoskeletal protein CcmA (bactofilin family)
MAKEDADLRNKLDEQRRRSQMIREQAQRVHEEPHSPIPRSALPDHNSLVIGEGVTFTGTISVPGTAIINGRVSGDLTADSLQIGKTGHISGKVRAKDIDVQGELHEEITCENHILIHSTGIVSGKLDYAELEIVRGGQFRGTMSQRTK